MPSESSPTQHLREIVRSRQKLFLNLFIISLILGLGRYVLPWPPQWMELARDLTLFVVGVLIAPFTFLTETMWKTQLEKHLQLRFGTQESPLRNGILFVLLPVLGLFVLTSSRSPIGLGFLWGISAWYAGEVWQMMQGNTELIMAYFPSAKQRAELPLEYIFWGYCLYSVVLTFGILFI